MLAADSQRLDSPLLEELRGLREAMAGLEAQEAATLEGIAPSYRPGARNLLHFIGCHRQNHPGLQRTLRERGLCSLQGCDAHLMASLTAVIEVLQLLEDRSPAGPSPGSAQPASAAPAAGGPGPRFGETTLASHCELLFGPPCGARDHAIMVTLPGEAAGDPDLIRELVEAGMGIARINCAHDDAQVWSALVKKIRAASTATGRPCRIAMDLAGPKLRTGPLPPLPGVIEAAPRRDRYGRLLEPAQLLALPAPGWTRSAVGAPVRFPVIDGGWQGLAVGDRLRGRDASGRWRELVVGQRQGEGLLLHAKQRCRLTGGLRFDQEGGQGWLEVAPLPPDPGVLLLRPGDQLKLTATPTSEEGAISCTLPEVFADLAEGERVLFDDGKIAGVILSVTAAEVLVEIVSARPRGSRLRPGRGINFPDSDLHTPALTAKDLEDLAFAAGNADLVSYSFVSREADIEALHGALRRCGRDDLAVVLKIETRRAFLNLPRLLLAAMRWPSPLGVMIARGDLAIECGWEALAGVQEEILRLCEAAHLPCIWATQVLDEMARHGTPTRAEITDALMGARAGALMLNKGPNITATVRILSRIAERNRPGPSGVPLSGDPLPSCVAYRTNCGCDGEPLPESGGG